MTFFEQIYLIVELIPYGKVASYSQIARMLGKPRSAREVGRAMRCCPADLPYHRVVMADGSITGGIHTEMRKQRLQQEGVIFISEYRVNMKKSGWNELQNQ